MANASDIAEATQWEPTFIIEMSVPSETWDMDTNVKNGVQVVYSIKCGLGLEGR